MGHAEAFFDTVREAAARIDRAAIDELAADLVRLRGEQGRLFILGVGGSAGNAGHAVNDFRKLCGIEAYAPTDNVSELTARTNDEGWQTIFSAWLEVSNLSSRDALFILSVGGGDEARNISVNLIEAIKLAKSRGAKTFGIVGRPDGYAALNGENVITVPAVDPNLVTPISESFQALVWHCLVSHPTLQTKRTKW